MGNYDPKPSIGSGTFWGAIVGGITGIFQFIGGIKTGNTQQMGEGALAVVLCPSSMPQTDTPHAILSFPSFSYSRRMRDS